MFFKNKSTCNFGEHFTLDGYQGDFEKLNDEKIVHNCLTELPAMLHMNKLADPVVYSAPEGSEKDCGGWSGFVVIAESHISIHTFPKRGFVSIDVYTCKNGIDTKFISSYFIDKFHLKNIETNLIKRGTRYPVQNIV